MCVCLYALSLVVWIASCQILPTNFPEKTTFSRFCWCCWCCFFFLCFSCLTVVFGMFSSHVYEFDTFEFPIQCSVYSIASVRNSQWPCLITFLTLFTSLLNMHHDTRTHTHRPRWTSYNLGCSFIWLSFSRYRCAGVSVCCKKYRCFGACFTKVIFTAIHTQTLTCT